MNMTIEIRRLTETSKEEIYQAFTEAFQNYVIPIVFNQEATLARWELAGVRYDLSFGAFIDSRLVAFVLHTSSDKTLYNFGTGVVPEYRGRHLIELIYQQIEKIPDFNSYLLEVIQENTKAYHLYKKLGFIESRKLHSHQGQLTIEVPEDTALNYSILKLAYDDELSKIQLYNPSFENAKVTTLKNPEFYERHEIRDDSELLAYAIYCPTQLGLKEVGAKDDYEKNLDRLFLKMKLNHERLRIMNIDEKAQSFHQYLTTRGLFKFVTQYEMIKKP
jgi:ribosomal protein S18 acetylase RimI-like enzyme